MKPLEYYDSSLDDVRGQLTPPDDQHDERVDWRAIENLLDEAEAYPVNQDVVKRLGELASRVSKKDNEVRLPDGTSESTPSYTLKGSGKKSTLINIDPEIGKRLTSFEPLMGPVEPEPVYMDHLKSAPELHAKAGAWLKIDTTASRRHELEANIARRDVMRAISNARDSGELRDRIAEALPSVLDSWKAEFDARLAEKRNSSGEKTSSPGKGGEHSKTFSFEEFLYKTRNQYTEEQKKTANRRYNLALQLGFIKNTSPTIGDNQHLATFEALNDEPSWNRIIESAGNNFRNFIELNGLYNNTPSELRSRYVRFLKFAGEFGTDVSDEVALAESLDDNVRWKTLLREFTNNFSKYLRKNSDFKGSENSQLRNNIVSKFRSMLKDGSIMEMNTSSYQTVATALRKMIDDENFAPKPTTADRDAEDYKKPPVVSRRDLKLAVAEVGKKHRGEVKKYAKELHDKLLEERLGH